MPSTDIRDVPSTYWNEGVATYRPAPVSPAARYDVAVIGAGYSGLAVAWGLARAGSSVLVIEAGEIGHGASSRSGGMVGPSFHKLGIAGLSAKYGEERAHRLMRAGIEALDYCQDLFAAPDFDVDFSMPGRFRGARTPDDLTSMIAECERLKAAVGLPFEIVRAEEVAAFTGARCYCGGVYYPRDGGIHPRKLVNAIAARAERAGAALLTGHAVQRIRRIARGFELEVPGGVVEAGTVVQCTNGYSDAGVRLMRARVVPIDVSVAATRVLGAERMRALAPRLLMQGESGRVFIWSRPSPDGQRFIFGGRISSIRAPVAVQRAQIADHVRRLYPTLEAADFEHVWNGRIAYTSDHAPHLSCVNGVWMMGGYCGSGVTRSFYFADKLVRKLTGQSGGDTAFDELGFPKVPFRRLAPAGARLMTRYYALRDRHDGRS